MVLRLILLLAGLAGLWFVWIWLSRLPPERRRKTLILGGFALLAAVGLALMLSGKISGLLAIIAGLSPWIGRALRLHGIWRTIQGLRSGTAKAAGATPPHNIPDGVMTPAQAYEILGLTPGASTEAVRDAHRRLMRANHPDAGGSTWIAARLNQARDLLLSFDA